MSSDFVQFSVRLTKQEYALLKARVKEINSEHEDVNGIPGKHTTASLSRFFIVSNLGKVGEVLTRQVKTAEHLVGSLSKLRGIKT